MRLSATLLLRCPDGGPHDRDRHTLEIIAALVPPVRIYPESQRVGGLAPGAPVTRSFWYWSSTRDRLELAPAGPLAACLGWRARPLTGPACVELAAKLRRDGIRTHVRAACRVDVTVYEARAGKELSLDALHRPVPVTARADGEPVQAPSLLLFGWFRSGSRPELADPQERLPGH